MKLFNIERFFGHNNSKDIVYVVASSARNAISEALDGYNNRTEVIKIEWISDEVKVESK